MREPQGHDDAAIAAIDLVVRLNGSPRVVDRFVREAEARPTADSWFYAGLAAWSLMDVTAHSLRKHSLLMAALDHLSAALRIEPDHWPARFLRASYVTMLHSDEADEMIAFLLPPAYGITPAREDARLLIDLQSAAAPGAPFGLAAYCLAAVQALMAGDEPAAWETLRAGLASTRPGPAPALAAQVAMPVVIALRRPELAGQPGLRAELSRRCRSLAGSAEPARNRRPLREPEPVE
jgi:hypothetical protein